MKIKRILNNNAVVSEEQTGREVIITGLGIAFKKKVGDEVPESKIEKKYVMDNQDLITKFQHILENTSNDTLKIVTNFVDEIESVLGTQVNEIIYISLIDHLNMAIERWKKGISLKNPMKWDVENYYPKEFSLARKLIEHINLAFGTDFDDDEASFIGLNIVNATGNFEFHHVYESTKLMHEITNLIKYYFNLEFDEKSVYYYRFVTHLRYFTQRVFEEKSSEDNEVNELLTIVKKKHPRSFDCANKIAEFVKKKTSYQVNEDEKLYLTLHISRIVEKTK